MSAELPVSAASPRSKDQRAPAVRLAERARGSLGRQGGLGTSPARFRREPSPFQSATPRIWPTIRASESQSFRVTLFPVSRPVEVWQ